MMGKKLRADYVPHLEWLPVGLLQVRQEAQRKFDPQWAATLASVFDPGKFGVLHVAAIMNGKDKEQMILVSGQHRAAAAREVFGPEHQVPCIVMRGLDIVRAAELFRGISKTRGVRPIDDFLVGVTARDAECLAIKDIANRAGLRIAHEQAKATVSAITALRRIYRSGTDGPDRLKATLDLVIDSWGLDAESFHGEVLQGIALFLGHYTDAIDRAALKKKLQSLGSATVLLGRGRGVVAGLGGSVVIGIARFLVEHYNRGRRTLMLPEWSHKRGIRDTDSVAVQGIR